MPADDRYSRQVLHPPIGAAGQARLRAARVLLTGSGGLGAEAASLLARAGVGFLRIVDRDVDQDYAIQRLIIGAFYQSGQSCISVQRIFIHESLYEPFKAKLDEIVERIMFIGKQVLGKRYAGVS